MIERYVICLKKKRFTATSYQYNVIHSKIEERRKKNLSIFYIFATVENYLNE